MARDFNQAMENGNLPAARKILAEMQAVKPGQVKDRRRRLENRIDKEVETLLERGRFLYTRGDLQKALKTWEQGLELKPDDPKLQQNIRRARTFLDNLDRWRN
jgi:tetratricopeptide (TPR) repeat protein